MKLRHPSYQQPARGLRLRLAQCAVSPVVIPRRVYRKPALDALPGDFQRGDKVTFHVSKNKCLHGTVLGMSNGGWYHVETEAGTRDVWRVEYVTRVIEQSEERAA